MKIKFLLSFISVKRKLEGCTVNHKKSPVHKRFVRGFLGQQPSQRWSVGYD